MTLKGKILERKALAEISRLAGPEVNYPLYDVTSSGLTPHVDFFFKVRNGFSTEISRYRLGDQLTEFNFGEIDIQLGKDPVRIALQIRDRSANVRLAQEVTLSDLQSK